MDSQQSRTTKTSNIINLNNEFGKSLMNKAEHNYIL